MKRSKFSSFDDLPLGALIMIVDDSTPHVSKLRIYLGYDYGGWPLGICQLNLSGLQTTSLVAESEYVVLE